MAVVTMPVAVLAFGLITISLDYDDVTLVVASITVINGVDGPVRITVKGPTGPERSMVFPVGTTVLAPPGSALRLKNLDPDFPTSLGLDFSLSVVPG